MKKKFITEFVDNIPENISEGIIYISFKEKMTSHICPCGCANKINIGFDSNSKWTIQFHPGDDSISISPIIDNCSLPCKSNYCIKHNYIVDASLNQ